MTTVRRRAGLGLVLAGSLVVAALPLQAATRPAAKGLQGTVTAVHDGNTISVTPPGQAALVVRLREIEAPELCQPWGPDARSELADLALNKAARVTPHGRDVQGRVVATVVVDEVDLSVRMVEEGLAWSSRTHSGHGPLLKQEKMARALSRGLHRDPRPLAPSEYRRLHGPCPTPAR